jgi:hypothetical protein
MPASNYKEAQAKGLPKGFYRRGNEAFYGKFIQTGQLDMTLIDGPSNRQGKKNRAKSGVTGNEAYQSLRKEAKLLGWNKRSGKIRELQAYVDKIKKESPFNEDLKAFELLLPIIDPGKSNSRFAKLPYLTINKTWNTPILERVLIDTNSVVRFVRYLHEKLKTWKAKITFGNYLLPGVDSMEYLTLDNISNIQTLLSAIAKLQKESESYTAMMLTSSNSVMDTAPGKQFAYFNKSYKGNSNTLLELIADTVEIEFTLKAGGCSKKTGGTYRVIGDGNYYSPPGRHSAMNCGLICLLQFQGTYRGFDGLSTVLRKKYKLVKNTRINIKTLDQICQAECSDTRVYTMEKGELVNEYYDADHVKIGGIDAFCMLDPIKRIVLVKDHYFMFDSKLKCKYARKSTTVPRPASMIASNKLPGHKLVEECFHCGEIFVGSHKDCSQKRINYRNNVIHKAKKNRLATLDFETFQQHVKIMYGGKNKTEYIGKHVPTLLRVSYVDEETVTNGTELVMPEVSEVGWLGLDCADRFLDWLYEKSEEGIKFSMLAHNGSKFDFFFILNAILNSSKYSHYYDHKESIYKANSILSFSVFGHTFTDSANHMASSLDTLSKQFKIPCPKITEIINDEGKVVSPMEICLDRQDELGAAEWLDWMQSKGKEHTLKAYIDYCRYDTISLIHIWIMYQYAIEIMADQVGVLKDIRAIHTYATLPSLSKAIWVADCEKKGIVHTKLTPEQWHFFNEAKIGGISHCNKPAVYIDQQIVGVDVVSLYPSVMTTESFGCGECIETDCEKPGKYGAYRITNVVLNRAVGINAVPEQVKSGLNWVSDTLRDRILCITDINRLRADGCTLDVGAGYYFTSQYNPFGCLDVYMNEKKRQDVLKTEKSPEANVALREVCKLLANSLFGKTMESTPTTKIVSLAKATPKQKAEGVRRQINNEIVLVITSVQTKSPIHLGVEILAKSKGTLFSYADDLIGKRHSVLCTETDSFYVQLKNLPKRSDKPPTSMHHFSYDESKKALGNMSFIFEANGSNNCDIVSQYFMTLAKKNYMATAMYDMTKKEYIDGSDKLVLKGIPKRNLEVAKFIRCANGEDVEYKITQFNRDMLNFTGPQIKIDQNATRVVKAQHGKVPVYDKDSDC